MGNCQAATGITVPDTFQGIILTCRTWKSTYSGLYDYTADPTQYHQEFLTCNPLKNPYFLSKELEHSPKIITSQQGILNDSVLKFTQNDNFYFVQQGLNIKKLTTNQTWIAVKSTPTKKLRLREGDIMRIGNQRVKIKQIILDDSQTDGSSQLTSKFKVYDKFQIQDSQGYNPPEGEQQPICRVCLEEGETDNPLLALCKCSGSAKFIHIKCIQEWFNKIINPHTVNGSLIITWKPLVCQLCNHSLPFKIYVDGSKHFTVNIPKPEKPYLVLNPLFKEKSSSKIYHLVSFSKKKTLLIGRKKDSDIILDEDSSISRTHSALTFQQAKNGRSSRVVLEDKESKFGTLVLFKRVINLSKMNGQLTLQFGGSIVNITSQRKGINSQCEDQQQINKSDESKSEESGERQQ